MDREGDPPSGDRSLSDLASHELLRRAREGDSHALDRLFARYLPQLHHWAHRRVPPWARNSADTNDLVQETVLHTLHNLESFEPQRDGALLGYLRRSLLNRVRDQFRQAARHPAPGVLDERAASAGQSPLDFTINQQDRRRYLAALKKMRSVDRRAIVACVELGYSYDQLALILDKPTAEAARLAVRRALLRLGDEMRRA
ncbi:MAG: sigma-70 family RNA polymerase sigma factor [Acidobacteria bacterium]|nr:sigma-70 family RNA polymerase sigma factor [Acidobacteriota bacterium]